MSALPPSQTLRELAVRWRGAGAGGIKFADELNKWRMQCTLWLGTEAGKARRSAKSWERKGEPKLAEGWTRRAEFCERMLKELIGGTTFRMERGAAAQQGK